jgi:Tol biopolymer transport system component
MNDRFDLDLRSWLDSETETMVPGWLHDSAIARAMRTPQRPGWRVGLGSLWDGAGSASRGRQQRLALTAVVALLALAGLAIWILGARQETVLPSLRNGQILVARTTAGPVAEYLTMNADGSKEQLVFEARDCGQCAFWSPDGSRILIPEVRDGRLMTAVVRADGAAKIVLQPLPGSTVNLGPGGWSPDGSLIALAGWDDTDPTRRGIYVAAPDGTALRQVSRSQDGRPHDWTSFSPDGSRILFVAADPVGPSSGGIAGDLMIVNLDGTGLRRLNRDGTKVVATVRAGRPMDWSPDGSRIAFAAIEGDLDLGRSAVYLVPAGGGEPARVTDPGESVLSVDWAPTGNLILSGDSTGGTESIWTLDASRGERRTLWTSTPGDAACCGTWSPDGRLILFERGEPRRRDLWTMDVGGTVVGQVTRMPADYVWYSWTVAKE